MKKAKITYTKAKMLTPLTRAYIDGDKRVRHLYDWSPSVANVEKVIEQRQTEFPVDREVLVQVLEAQYSGLDTGAKVRENIHLLRDENTFTVTTGHQLNLFTGPLYFVYKIISVIKAAEELGAKYPKYRFVPVYWMATEDADFDEINHTYINGQKLVWNTSQTGMVGEFETSDMQEVFEHLSEVLGNNISVEEIRQFVSEAYLQNKTLADATRFLVNRLFENDGLVILDANNRELKRQFTEIIKDELLHESGYRWVNETVSTFPKEFSVQVKPREINLFYAIHGLRERIVRGENGFEVVHTDIRFSAEELMQELENYPERFSPNVILRPLYQERILPNLMYFGGGAEVAYWLELKALFAHHGVSYPLVQIRNAFLVLDGNAVKKVVQCCLSVEELFLPEDEQVRCLLKGDNPFYERLKSHKAEVDEKIKTLIQQIEEFDPSLIPSLKSTKAGILSELKKLDRKVMKSVKRKNQIKLDRLKAIREIMYPGGVFQERRVNFIQMIRQFGPRFFDIIKSNTEPFDTHLFILYPDEAELPCKNSN